MAKHFKTDVEPTKSRRRSKRHAKDDEVRTEDTGRTPLPYGQAATYHYTYPSAVVRENYYEDELPARGGLYAFGRFLMLLVAWALRLCALAFFCLVVLNVLSISAIRPSVMRVTDAVTSYLPWAVLGTPSVDTPFGGVFRIDLALVSLVFFVLDWIACNVRATLR